MFIPLTKREFLIYARLMRRRIREFRPRMGRGFMGLKMSSTGTTGKRKELPLTAFDVGLLSLMTLAGYLIIRRLVGEMPKGKMLITAGTARDSVITAMSLAEVAKRNWLLRKLFDVETVVFKYETRDFVNLNRRIDNISKLAIVTLAVKAIHRAWQRGLLRFAEKFIVLYSMDALTPRQWRLLQDMGVWKVLPMYGASEIGLVGINVQTGPNLPPFIIFPYTTHLAVKTDEGAINILSLAPEEEVEGELLAYPYLSWGGKGIPIGDIVRVRGLRRDDFGAAELKLLGRKRYRTRVKLLGSLYDVEVDYRWRLTEKGFIHSTESPIPGILSVAVINSKDSRVLIVTEGLPKGYDVEEGVEVFIDPEAVANYFEENIKAPRAIFVDPEDFDRIRRALLERVSPARSGNP